MVTGYVDAFNKHDAEALANYWSPDAVYIDRVTGEEVSGHERDRQTFHRTVQGPARLEDDCQHRIDSVRFAERGD